MTSRVWLGEEPGRYAKLTENVYVPEGSRSESADGDVVYVIDEKKRLSWTLRTETKVAERLDIPPRDLLTSKEETDLKKRFESFGKSMKVKDMIKTHSAMLRGYKCKVTEVDFKYGDERRHGETWEAVIGGHEVTLRGFSRTYKAGVPGLDHE